MVFFITAWPYRYCTDDQDDIECPARSQHSGQPTALTSAIPLLISQGGGIMFICHLGCWMGFSSLLGWIIFAVCYILRIVVPYNRGPHAFNPDLFVFGLVVNKWPLTGHEFAAKTLSEYWPLVFMFLLFFSMPEAKGRCDLHPMNMNGERFRFYAVEATIVATFATGAMNTSDSQGVTGWLGAWSLFAYCTHVAWDQLLPRPYGALLTYSFLPGFRAVHLYGSRNNAGNRDRSPGRRIQLARRSPILESQEEEEADSARTSGVLNEQRPSDASPQA